MREERRCRCQKCQGADHGNRDADTHRDCARLPPSTRYVPKTGIPRTLVNYLRRGVGRPDSRVVATPKGTEVRVGLPQQSSLNPVRQIKTGARKNRGHSGQSSPQHAQHCHLIGLGAITSLPHALQFILHPCITVGDHPPKRCQDHELRRTHTRDRDLHTIVDSRSRQPLSTTLTLVAVKSSLYVMAGKRRRSIVRVTFIRVLMFLSRPV